MKRLLIIGMLLLSIASVSAYVGSSTKLLTAELSAIQGDATGKVSVRVPYGARIRSTARIETQGLPYLGAAGVYEAWFVHSPTGYKQSAGVFFSPLSGRAILTYTIEDDLGIFDGFEISREKFDNDPRQGNVVLSGDLVETSRRSFRRSLPNINYKYSERSIGYYPYSLGK